jgi:hypothetical protein
LQYLCGAFWETGSLLTRHNISLWLRYDDDAFVFWPHGSENLQNFLSHLNSLRTAIQFSMEIESDYAILILDDLVTRKETTLATKVYRKPTHNGRHLTFSSNYPQHLKRDSFQSLRKRAPIMRQERQDLCNEITSPRSNLQLNGCPRGFFNTAINSKGSSSLSKEESLCVLCPIYETCLGEI